MAMTAPARRRDNMRTVKLWHGHDYVDSSTGNTANVRSLGLVIAPPNNVFLVVDRRFRPVIKLFDSAGDEISEDTKVYLGKKRPGDNTPTYVPGVFTLSDFVDLTAKEQRNSENRETLTQDLGRGIALREQEELHIEFEGPDVIDWDQAGTRFEFAARWSAQ